MSSLLSLSAMPAENSVTAREIFAAAQVWLDGEEAAYKLFERFHLASKTVTRRYAISLEEILLLDGQVERTRRFAELGVPLACRVVTDTLRRAELTPADVSTVVFTSCTSPQIPALDAEVVQRLGFPATVRRVPMYQQGCAGGVVGLSLAGRLADGGETVLLLSVELCSLLFRLRESSTVQLLGSALFADGAAASVIVPGSGRLRIVGSQSFLIPESAHLMGYDIREDGPYLRLDRDLPGALRGQLAGIVDQFLERGGLKVSQIPWWIIHPGGVKILEGIGDLLGLRPDQYLWAQEVLSTIGNMSSATVQFVLSDFLADSVVSPGDHVIMVGIGPGLTVELILFQYGA